MSKKFMSLAPLLFGVFAPLLAHGDMSFSVGPMNLDVADRGGFRRGGGREGANVEDTVCRAIQKQSLLVVIRGEEGQKQKKDETLERFVIEPYALGYNKDGALIIRGYQITEFAVPKEFRRPKEDKEPVKGGIGFVGGLLVDFNSDSLVDIKVPDVREIRVLNHSHFKVRSNDELGKHDDMTKLQCSLYDNDDDDSDSDNQK